MRIGITGYKGMVGQELLKYPDVVPLPCDVRKPDEIEMAVKNTKVDLIVHLAAITDVDKCEDNKNFNLVKDTNVVGTMNVCDVAESLDCGVVLLSTFQVFDGRWGNYKERSKPNPVNFYGLTKFSAEQFTQIYNNLKVVRAGYLFDYKRLFGEIYGLRMGKSKDYPSFMERSFIYLPHFAEALYFYLLNWDRMPTILHIAGSKPSVWYEFMLDVARVFRMDTKLIQRRTFEIGSLAPRPHYAGLNVGLSNKLGIPQFGHLEGLMALRELG